jgi:hypothetical protein
VNNTHVISDIHHIDKWCKSDIDSGNDTPDLVVEYPQGLSTDTPILAGIPESYAHDVDHIPISRSNYPHDLHHKTQCPFCPTYWSVNVSGRCYTSSIKIEQ